jgi:hypothetical protein
MKSRELKDMQLWGELNLTGLVGGDDNGNGSPNAAAPNLAELLYKDLTLKPMADKKKEQVFKKAHYGAIMGRYNSVPHNPKSISPSKINLLADPLRGRYSSYDKVKSSEVDSDEEAPPRKGPETTSVLDRYANPKKYATVAVPAAAIATIRQPKSPVKAAPSSSSAFFLTEADGGGDDENDDNYGHFGRHNAEQRNGRTNSNFASAMRNTIQDASNKMEKYKTPILASTRNTALSRKATKVCT